MYVEKSDLNIVGKKHVCNSGKSKFLQKYNKKIKKNKKNLKKQQILTV